MSTLQVDQALTQAFIEGDFKLSDGTSLPVAHENLPFEPAQGTPYAELLVLQNDTTPYSLAHSNQTDGVFRVILRYPVESGAIEIKKMADAIFAVFGVGVRLVYQGTTVTMMGNQREPGLAEDGWYKIVLTMPYRAFLKR